MIGLSSRIASHLRDHKELNRMFRSEYAGTRAIAAAVVTIANYDFSMDEKAWISKISSLERDLASRIDEMITFTDFGAGDPGMNMTEEQMAQGRRLTRSVAAIYKGMTIGHKWRLLLFRLIRRFKPSSCIELGTSLGVSAAFQTTALELNRCGQLATLEGGEGVAAVAQENFRKLGLRRVQVFIGRFQDTLGSVLTERAPVDYVFVDGHHDEQATLRYYERLYPYLSDGALLIFDDIFQYEGMQRAWKRLTDRPEVRVAVDFGTIGACVVSTSAGGCERYRLRNIGWTMKGRLRRASARLQRSRTFVRM